MLNSYSGWEKEVKRFGYKNSVKLNASGRVALDEHGSYSEYKKHQIQAKEADRNTNTGFPGRLNLPDSLHNHSILC